MTYTTTRTKWIVSLLAGAALAGLALFWLVRDPVPAPRPQANPIPSTSVRVARAERGTVQSWIFGEGTARSVRREYLIFPNAGRVAYVKKGLREGDRVRAGEVLAYQDPRQYDADVTATNAAIEEARSQQDVARAQLAQSKTEAALAAKKLERFERLLALNSAAPQEVDQARTELARATAAVDQAQSRIAGASTQISATQAKRDQARVRKQDTTLVSPIDGVVAYLNINEGDYFMPSILRTDSEQNALQTVPIVVISPDRYEVTVEVPSFQRGLVERGQATLIAPGGESGARAGDRHPPVGDAAKGEVHSVTPAVTPGERALKVKIRTTGGTEKLRDGMFVGTWIAAGARKDVVVVPVDVFVYRDNRPYVFVIDPTTSTVAERAVQTGVRGLATQEIVSGVNAGDVLVTEGRHQLADGARVRVLDGVRGGIDAVRE